MNGRCTTCGEWDIDDLHKCEPQSMTKTTAEVKRWRPQVNHLTNGPFMSRHDNGEFVLATDYATLQQRCSELTECVRELLENEEIWVYRRHGELMRNLWVRDEVITKAESLLGGEKGVVT